MSNLDRIVSEMEKNSSQESDFFKFPVGDTKIRILTDFHQTFSLYEGEYPNSKYVRMLPRYVEPAQGTNIKVSAWAWAIVRGKPDTLKIVQFPFSLMKALGGLKSDPEWEFDTFPMPYDITIGNTGEGGARYSLRGSPKRTEIAESTLDELGKRKTCEEIARKIMEKQGTVLNGPMTAESSDEVPFPDEA